jgi:hypothetical protein
VQLPGRVKPRPPRLAERRGLYVEEVIGGRQNSALDRQRGRCESPAATRIMPECVLIQKDFARVERPSSPGCARTSGRGDALRDRVAAYVT